MGFSDELKVRVLSGESGEWKRFLSDEGNARLIVHTPEWKEFFEKSFPKTRSVYYAVEDEAREKIRIVFPFAFVKHPLFGRAAISCAFIEYGGPAGDANAASNAKAGSSANAAVQAVLSEVSRECSRQALDYAEVRSGVDAFDSALSTFPGAVSETPFKRGLTRLGASPDEVFASFDKEARKAVRKAASEGVTARELEAGDEPAAYELYLRGMQRFGSPPLHERFFKNFWSMLVSKGLARVFGAFKNGELAALLAGYCYANRVHVIINVSEPRLQKHFPNDAVHWAFMEWACGNGFAEFDWGRVREESGQFQFKKKWNTEFKDLRHHYLLGKAKEPPRIDPRNAKYAAAISLWRRTPLFVARRLGPWIREGMGI